jgi:hypothetical protein
MQMSLYAVFDKVAEESGPIFQAKNDLVALRNFQHLIQDQRLNPEDYQLFWLAYYDTEHMDFDTRQVQRPITFNSVEIGRAHV